MLTDSQNTGNIISCQEWGGEREGRGTVYLQLLVPGKVLKTYLHFKQTGT